MISVNGIIISETERAILFLWDHPHKRPVWLPKSRVGIHRGEWSDTVRIPRWLAERHKISPRPTPKRLNGEIDHAGTLPNLKSYQKIAN